MKTFDYEELAKFVEKNETAGEPILIYRNGHSLPFEYYYEGVNRIYPLPRDIAYDYSYFSSSILQDTIGLHQEFQVSLADNDRFIVLTDSEEVCFGYDTRKEILNDYIDRYFLTFSDTLIYGRVRDGYFRVRELGRK